VVLQQCRRQHNRRSARGCARYGRACLDLCMRSPLAHEGYQARVVDLGQGGFWCSALVVWVVVHDSGARDDGVSSMVV
jgi:hypothetical protein